MRVLAALVLVLGIGACGDDDGGSADAGNDAGVVNDAGGQMDSGSPMDASASDAAASDSGTPTDSGATDAGPEDAGPQGALCPASEACNIVTHTGCEAEQRCYLGRPSGGGTATGMCAAPGTAALGDACTTVNGCADGLSCIGGQCRAMCCGESDADCPGGGVCSGRTEVDGIGYCLIPDGCDLLEQTGCPDAEESCYPLTSAGGTVCASTGEGAPGAACMASNACVRGSICLADDICHSLCNPDEDTCGDGMNCAPLTSFDGVGVCVAAE